MKTRNHAFSQGALTPAMRLALLALFAAPALVLAQSSPEQLAEAAKVDDDNDPDVKAVTCPTNFVELGAMNVSKGSPKFGEYTGLERSGGYGIGNFGLSGGSGYCRRGGNLRWQFYGTNLGTTSRNLGLEAGQQGRWSFGLNFDQLRHYTTTGYQTPFQGSMGSNLFVLPPSFGVISTVNAGAGGGTMTLTPAQLAAFHSVNVYNQRQNTTLSAGYAFNTEWNFKFDYKHLNMSGAKLIGASTDNYNMPIWGLTNGLNYTGQRPSLLMNPTQSSTDTFNFAFNWVGEKAYSSFEYYASLYRDEYRGVSWSNPYVTGGTAAAPNPATGALPGGAFPLNTLSTPPSNQLHQLNFTGGYIFSPATKLSGGLSFGVNTQNSSYDGTYTATPNTAPGLPVNSLNGKVLTKHADARLTHRFTPALNFDAGFKYNERDNTTDSNAYSFLHLGSAPAAGTTTVVPTVAVNAPMSNRREQLDANLDYRIDQSQKLRFSYAYDHLDRWCNNALANNAQGVLPASAPNYYVTASCVQVPKSIDNSLTASYRLALFEKVNFNASYTYADRRATINPSFYNPMQSFNQGFENYGFLAFFQAPRREDLVKTGVNWQVSDKFSLGLSGWYTMDRYYDSTLGVQKGRSSDLNLDANYSPTDDISFGAYVSWQNRSRDLTTAFDRVPVAPGPVNLWYNSLTDRDTTVGFAGKQKLLHGKLELVEDFSYGLGNSKYDTTPGPNIALAPGNSGTTPDIRSRFIQLRLTGTYTLNKAARVSVGYMYQRLKSSDYLYNGYQYGSTPIAVMPNNMQTPTYKANVVYVIYRYTFQ